jgi:hypothetical protein
MNERLVDIGEDHSSDKRYIGAHLFERADNEQAAD